MNLKKIILIVLGAGVFLLLAIGILNYLFGGGCFPETCDPDYSGNVGDIIQEQSREEGIRSRKMSFKLSINSQIQLEKGSEIIENVGVGNTESTEKVFGINIEYAKKRNPDNSTAVAPEGADEISFFYNNAIDNKLAPDARVVIPIRISAKSSAAGDYLYHIDVLTETVPGACAQGLETPGCELYDTKSFFVGVS